MDPTRLVPREPQHGTRGSKPHRVPSLIQTLNLAKCKLMIIIPCWASCWIWLRMVTRLRYPASSPPSALVPLMIGSLKSSIAFLQHLVVQMEAIIPILVLDGLYPSVKFKIWGSDIHILKFGFLGVGLKEPRSRSKWSYIFANDSTDRLYRFTNDEMVLSDLRRWWRFCQINFQETRGYSGQFGLFLAPKLIMMAMAAWCYFPRSTVSFV